jgi:hypothetical protein
MVQGIVLGFLNEGFETGFCLLDLVGLGER